jgi:hypothetical protein
MYRNIRQETTPVSSDLVRHDREIIATKLSQTGGCLCGKIRYEITEAHSWFTHATVLTASA